MITDEQTETELMNAESSKISFSFSSPNKESESIGFSIYNENNSNIIIDRNGGKISKVAIIGIVCGIIAVALIAAVSSIIVVMRKKKMERLKSKESQSSILEDSSIKLQNDVETATSKDDDDSDLDFWL